MLSSVYEGLCRTGHITPILLTTKILAEIHQQMDELRMAFLFPPSSVTYS